MAKASKNGAVEEKPTMDFSSVGRDWKIQVRDSVNRATRAQIALQRPLHPEADADATQSHYDAQDAALITLEAEADCQARLIAQVLKDVPRGWLMTDTPESIDWSQAENLSYVRADCYDRLLQLTLMGQSAAAANAKN